jgi:hypothetical protein
MGITGGKPPISQFRAQFTNGPEGEAAHGTVRVNSAMLTRNRCIISPARECPDFRAKMFYAVEEGSPWATLIVCS